MARKSSRRVNSRAEQQERYEVWGNTVRKAEAIPEERPRRKSGVSRRAQRNRARAVQMSRGYVVFLAVVSVAALLMCVRYLKLKAEITTQTSEIASLESALNELKADNDALLFMMVRPMMPRWIWSRSARKPWTVWGWIIPTRIRSTSSTHQETAMSVSIRTYQTQNR